MRRAIKIKHGFLNLILDKAEVQFLNLVFVSLKETQFILKFAKVKRLLNADKSNEIREINDESARLIWMKTNTIESTIS